MNYEIVENKDKNDEYANHASISFAGETFSVRIPKKKSIPSGDLVKIQDVKNSWQSFIFQGGVVSMQLQGADLETLARVGLVDCDIEKLAAAVAAAAALEEARASYRKVMDGLGAQLESDGSYEDYRDWLVIEGVPYEWESV